MRDDGKVAGEKVRTGDRAATVESGNSQSDGIAANRSREGFEPATRRAAGSVDEVREMNGSAGFLRRALDSISVRLCP